MAQTERRNCTIPIHSQSSYTTGKCKCQITLPPISEVIRKLLKTFHIFLIQKTSIHFNIPIECVIRIEAKN